jgi:hypothetical protein
MLTRFTLGASLPGVLDGHSAFLLTILRWDFQPPGKGYRLRLKHKGPDSLRAGCLAITISTAEEQVPFRVILVLPRPHLVDPRFFFSDGNGRGFLPSFSIYTGQGPI